MSDDKSTMEQADSELNRDGQERSADALQALEEKNKQLEEANNRLLRLQADFDNFRRRTRQEKEEMSLVVANGVIAKMLPVLDNFERALHSAPGQDSGQFRAGMELVYRQFTNILEGLGVKPIDAVGAQFDPNLHEAVLRVEDSGQPDGLVVEMLEKGYISCDKVLRACKVKVVSNC